MLFPSEGLRAESAPVGRLPGMLPDVVQQMFLPGKSLRTEIATMGRLARVPHDVVRKVLLPGERFPADFTPGNTPILLFIN